MNETPAPASFEQPTTDAAAKAGQQKQQASRGDSDSMNNDANGQQVSIFLNVYHGDFNAS